MTGAELRAALQRLGLRQGELGAILGKHRVTVGHWMSGRAEVPRYVAAYMELRQRESWTDAMIVNHFGQSKTKSEIEQIVGRSIDWARLELAVFA